MRSVRPLIVGLLAGALLTASGVAAVAQSEEEQPAADAPATMDEQLTTPVVVSGTLECLDSAAEADGEAPSDQSVVTVHAWQASDERLTGEVTYGGRWEIYGEPSEDRGSVESSADDAFYEIVNEGGAWLCEAARGPEPRTGDTGHTLVFTGEGGYEGLTAYLHVDWSQTPYVFNGLILPGDEPPYAPPQG